MKQKLILHYTILLSSIMLFIHFFTNCNPKQKKNEQGNIDINTSMHFVAGFEKRKLDSSTFVKMKCGLYKNELGIVALQSLIDPYEANIPNSNDLIPIYLISVYGANKKQIKGTGELPMNKVIDTNSFIDLSGFYYRDKNNIYLHTVNSEGGHISIMN